MLVLRHFISLYTLLFFLLFSCNFSEDKADKKNVQDAPNDEHSYSNIDRVHTTHLHLDLDVDFDKKLIYGVARHTINNKGFDTIIFDTKYLEIEKVTVGNIDSEKEVKFILGPWDNDSILGQPLYVITDPAYKKINIYYQTTNKSIALDWLQKNQTEGKKHPFLYTQGEPILTRSWIPLQDSPGNRITYSATVKVPSHLLALMSAENPIEKNESGIYHFQMTKPIPSYLIALAVGNIEYKKIGENCGVYSEPELLKASSKEFEDLPEMIKAAESLYGPYQWGKYDILVLPYSFPFGGMENPMLTFVNPTIISGDKSLVSVVAHELAHSWSGNLVTNKTWNDFWLNEGFTVYFEHRIMEKIYGKEYADMLALVEYEELLNEIDDLKEKRLMSDSRLKLNLKGRDPDDAITQIAYVKGAFFLKTLENKVGRKEIDSFLVSYFNDHSFQSINSEQFSLYLKDKLLTPKHIFFNVEEWLYDEGMPSSHYKVSSSRFKKMKKLAHQFANGKNIFREKGSFEKNKRTKKTEFILKKVKRKDFSTQEWLEFIRNLPEKMNIKDIEIVDKNLDFTHWNNSEILLEWYLLCIKNNYKKAFPSMEIFLRKVGRRKYLSPIYKELCKTPENKIWAKKIFDDSKNYYHYISKNTINKIFLNK